MISKFFNLYKQMTSIICLVYVTPVAILLDKRSQLRNSDSIDLIMSASDQDVYNLRYQIANHKLY